MNTLTESIVVGGFIGAAGGAVLLVVIGFVTGVVRAIRRHRGPELLALPHVLRFTETTSRDLWAELDAGRKET